jgi:hypothetical protein
MEANWAAEHLQTIRTLMERSAIYRRALAPVMLLVGMLGCAAGGMGCAVNFDEGRSFVFYWVAVAAAALVAAFLLIRRQALKDAEPFWTPPTRRIAEAMIPLFFLGAVVSALALIPPKEGGSIVLCLPPIWMALYGCALHAAGFFAPRGIKWLGWVFLGGGTLLFLVVIFCGLRIPHIGNLMMGWGFGGLHLAYGIYLYFTEKRKNVA